MFGLFRGHQPKTPAHKIAPPPKTISRGIAEMRAKMEAKESAERIAEALREHFGDAKPSAASFIAMCNHEPTIEFDEEEYTPIKGIAFADYDVFERRLELLDRLIEIDKRDIPFAGSTDYGEDIRLLVDALMKDCDINADPFEGTGLERDD